MKRCSGTRLAILSAMLIGVSTQLSSSQNDDARLRALEAQVFAAVNRHRTSLGMSELAHSVEIARIARAHSDAMARGQRDFGHSGLQKRTAAIASRMPLSSAAENISRHSRDYGEVPHAAVQVWLDSARHRKNIEGDYDLSGVGAAQDSAGTYYLTQIFVAR